jgi:hypothetical protein
MATCEAGTILQDAATSGFTNLAERNKLDVLLQLLCNIADGGGSGAGTYESLGLPCSDQTSQLQAANSVFSLRAPAAFTASLVYITLDTANTGTTVIDVNLNGSTIVGGGLSIVSGTAVSSGALAVAIAQGDLIAVDIVSVPASTGTGLKVWVIGDRT